jgi:hypothetical protein
VTKELEEAMIEAYGPKLKVVSWGPHNPDDVGAMAGLWLRVRIWYGNRLLDLAEWFERRGLSARQHLDAKTFCTVSITRQVLANYGGLRLPLGPFLSFLAICTE